MGWINFIIIEDWKMVIETNRAVDDLEDYITQSLDKIINGDSNDISTSDLKVADITINDLCTFASAYENMNALVCMEFDKLFLYWLTKRDIKYEIKAEYNVEIEDYEKNGYRIIRR